MLRMSSLDSMWWKNQIISARKMDSRTRTLDKAHPQTANRRGPITTMKNQLGWAADNFRTQSLTRTSSNSRTYRYLHSISFRFSNLTIIRNWNNIRNQYHFTTKLVLSGDFILNIDMLNNILYLLLNVYFE